jgi:hypothetical protein
MGAWEDKRGLGLSRGGVGMTRGELGETKGRFEATEWKAREGEKKKGFRGDKRLKSECDMRVG